MGRLMIRTIRSSSAWRALVCFSGLATAILIYIGSFRGTTMDSIFRWAIFLHIGVFVLLLPMYAFEYSAIRSRTFF